MAQVTAEMAVHSPGPSQQQLRLAENTAAANAICLPEFLAAVLSRVDVLSSDAIVDDEWYY